MTGKCVASDVDEELKWVAEWSSLATKMAFSARAVVLQSNSVVNQNSLARGRSTLFGFALMPYTTSPGGLGFQNGLTPNDDFSSKISRVWCFSHNPASRAIFRGKTVDQVIGSPCLLLFYPSWPIQLYANFFASFQGVRDRDVVSRRAGSGMREETGSHGEKQGQTLPLPRSWKFLSHLHIFQFPHSSYKYFPYAWSGS